MTNIGSETETALRGSAAGTVAANLIGGVGASTLTGNIPAYEKNNISISKDNTMPFVVI